MEWPLVGREADLDRAVALVESGTGIAILGPAGVGKSRLLHELVDRAGDDGMAVISTVASASSRSIPFAPFVDLLPEEPTQDRLVMLGMARRALEERESQGGLLIAIDDAHHLDEASLAFLLGAVSHRTATVALTARAGEPMEPDLVDLWTNGVITRVDLSALDRRQSRLLAESALGEIDPGLEDELWRLSRGNPLLLHELVEGAEGDSVVRDSEGRWVLRGALAESARLGDLVKSRLGALPDATREAMAVVSLGAPIPLAIARSATGEAVTDLEDRGLVSLAGGPAGTSLVPAHPMYGEILAANLAPSRRTSIYRKLVDAHLAHGIGSDSLRAAIWQSRCGEVVSPELALAGAEEALVRHEPALAEALTEQLGTEDDRALMIMGRALSYQQRFAEAEQLLGARTVEDPALLGEIVSIRAQNLGYGLGRIDDARDLLADGAAQVGDPTMRSRLNNERAMISAINGDFVDVRSASGAVLSDDRSDEVARVAAYVALTVALAMTGDCDGIDEIAEEAIALASERQADLPFARDQIEIMIAMSLLNAGRIGEATLLANGAIDRADRGNAMTTTWLSALGLCVDLAGKFAKGVEIAESALDLYRESDPFGLEPQCRGILAMARGQMGDVEAAAAIHGVKLHAPAPRLTVWIDRGRAWSAAARGDVDEAAAGFVAGGRTAFEREHYAWATLCFHDAVRVGRPETALTDLRAIDMSRGARLLSAMRSHADALVDDDPEDLSRIGVEFAEMGAALLAAEAVAQAASIYESNGRQLEAARACARSMMLELRCQGADTPALRERPALVSEREVEVAIEAASGLTSPQISERLFISARTVDNHLSSVYRKLGVSGRDELAGMLEVVNE